MRIEITPARRIRDIPDDPRLGDNAWLHWENAIQEAQERAPRRGRQQVRKSSLRGYWLVQDVR